MAKHCLKPDVCNPDKGEEGCVCKCVECRPGLAWGWPLLSRKAHVFMSDCRSMCGKWLFSGADQRIERAPENRGPDDCAVCFKKLKAHFKPSASCSG